MQDVSTPDAAHVARAIEAYLAGHPGAADNEHGIATWWLPSLGIDAPTALVLAALDDLVGRGVVEEVKLPGASIYRAAAAAQRH